MRKYSGKQDLIWGDNHCEHQWGSPIKLGEGYKGNKRWQHLGGRVDEEEHWAKSIGSTSFCSLCGAWKGAFGLEPTPEMYVQHTIEILREIRRVLRKDGVVFWNIGDSYAGSGKGGNPEDSKWEGFVGNDDREKSAIGLQKVVPPGLKPKDLCLIPFRIAIAAQEDKWFVRSVIIWSKPNPMPESVTDRPTESHEYILMLTKAKNYYWDADAVREPISEATITRNLYPHSGGGPYQINRPRQPGEFGDEVAGRNLRSVWEFPTQPYPEAHFAVFPEKLPELCIKAATPEVGCCSKCSKPWVRISSRNEASPIMHDGEWEHKALRMGIIGTEGRGGRLRVGLDSKTPLEKNPGYTTLGWQPSCNCKDATKTPSIVLDPFMGTGTTLWVAKKLGRRAVGYDISEEYCRLALERNRQYAMEFKQE